jgi:hypothetical protein
MVVRLHMFSRRIQVFFKHGGHGRFTVHFVFRFYLYIREIYLFIAHIYYKNEKIIYFYECCCSVQTRAALKRIKVASVSWPWST